MNPPKSCRGSPVINVNGQFILRHIVPIYCVGEQGLPKLLGSSVYVHIDSLHVLLTAAHVTDAQDQGPLYIPGAMSCVLLPPPRFVSGNPQTIRNEDRFDFAWVVLEDKHVLALNARFSPLSLHQIDFDDITQPSDDYLFAGYFEAHYDQSLESGSFHHRLQAYFGLFLDDFHVFKKLDISPVTHIAIRWSKNNSVDLQGNSTIPPQPYGMSGGGVWQFSRGKRVVFPEHSRLCGIPIEVRKQKNIKTLVATRINFWFESIVAAYPALRPLIPKSRYLDLDFHMP